MLLITLHTLHVYNRKGYGLNVRGSSPVRVKNFLFSTASRPALGSTQPPIQWVLGPLSPEVKLTASLHLVPKSKMVELYLCSQIRLYGVVLN
jgi:hypothetical protein